MGKKEGGERRGGEAGCWKVCLHWTGDCRSLFWVFFVFLVLAEMQSEQFCELCYDLFAAVYFFFFFLRFVLVSIGTTLCLAAEIPCEEVVPCPQQVTELRIQQRASSPHVPRNTRETSQPRTHRVSCIFSFAAVLCSLAAAAARQPCTAKPTRVCSRLIIILFLPRSL